MGRTSRHPPKKSSSHLSLNHEGRWGTTDDFTTSFLHFSLFSIALWDWANSRPKTNKQTKQETNPAVNFWTLVSVNCHEAQEFAASRHKLLSKLCQICQKFWGNSFTQLPLLILFWFWKMSFSSRVLNNPTGIMCVHTVWARHIAVKRVRPVVTPDGFLYIKTQNVLRKTLSSGSNL